MNQSSALRFDDLSEEAAVVADTSLLVRARFVEAADTMLHIDVTGLKPAVLKGFWPEHILDYKEITLRYRPSAAAISRAEEVMYGWLLDYVSEEDRRVLLGKWSLCLAAPQIGGSFREFCKKSGRIRRTAERHLLQEFSVISSALLKSSQSLHEPNWSRVSPMMPNSASELDKFREPIPTSPASWIGVKPAYDPNDPEHVKMRDKLIRRIEKANRRRRSRTKQTAEAA